MQPPSENSYLLSSDPLLFFLEMTPRPKIKKFVFQVTLPCFLPLTLKFLSLFRGYPRSAILFPHLPHVKTFNKIKIFSYLPSLF